MGGTCSCDCAPARAARAAGGVVVSCQEARPAPPEEEGPRLPTLLGVPRSQEVTASKLAGAAALDVDGVFVGKRREAPSAPRDGGLKPWQVAAQGAAARPEPVAREPRHSEMEGAPGAPAVHVIVCALDYAKTRFPLTCTIDGDNMAELAGLCGAEVVKLYNEEATVAGVRKCVQAVGARCGPDDYFVFYYAGHGAGLPDQDGGEEDRDDAFCLVDERGQSCRLRDGDFAELVTSSLRRGTKVLVLADCCHSGRVLDLHRPAWDGHEVVAISGCKDQQTSEDTGEGGIFTHSLLLAIHELCAMRLGECTVAEAHRRTALIDETVFRSAQEITLQARTTARMMWPLMPPGDYLAPLQRPPPGCSKAAAEAAEPKSPPEPAAAPDSDSWSPGGAGGGGEPEAVAADEVPGGAGDAVSPRRPPDAKGAATPERSAAVDGRALVGDAPVVVGGCCVGRRRRRR